MPVTIETRLDIELHEGQGEAWESDARFKILAAGRRWGKSELGVWWALERARRDRIDGVDPSIGWYIAPTYKVARPVWRKFLRLAPPGWVTNTSGTERQPDSMDLGHVRIEFKTAEKPENLVAEGLRWVWIDEAGIIGDRVWTESIRPALMDYRAPAFISGTPKGHNWFHKLWTKGKDPQEPSYASFGGPSFENPWLDPDELEEIMRDMIPRLVKQEIFAEFLADTEGEVFSNVKAAQDEALRLFPNTDGYCNHPTFVIGADLGFRVDYTVLYGVCRDGHPTGIARFQRPWPETKRDIKKAVEEAGDPLLVIDQAGVGDPVVQDLQKMGVRLLGVQTGARKVALIDSLEIALNDLAILIPGGEDGEVVYNEMISFVYEITRHGNIRYSAPENMHDDCLREGTMIKTHQGYKVVEDVVPGDLVLTHMGRYRRVEANITKPFNGNFYRMKTRNNLLLEVSYNHPIYRASRSYDGDVSGPWERRGWTLPGNWKKTYRAVYRPETFSGTGRFLEEPDFYRNPAMARTKVKTWNLDDNAALFLGRFLADGHCRRMPGYTMELAFHLDDRSIFWFKKYLESVGMTCHTEAFKEQRCTKLVFSSKLLWHGLRQCYDGSRQKIIPPWFWKLGAHIPRVLDGWLDGDGWLNEERKINIGASTSLKLALEMRDIALAARKQAAIRKRETKWKDQYWVEVHEAHKPMACTKFVGGDAVFPVVSVEKFHHEGMVYNLQIEEDRSFVANGLVVHNCVIAASLAAYGLLNAPPAARLWGITR